MALDTHIRSAEFRNLPAANVTNVLMQG